MLALASQLALLLWPVGHGRIRSNWLWLASWIELPCRLSWGEGACPLHPSSQVSLRRYSPGWAGFDQRDIKLSNPPRPSSPLSQGGDSGNIYTQRTGIQVWHFITGHSLCTHPDSGPEGPPSFR